MADRTLAPGARLKGAQRGGLAAKWDEQKQRRDFRKHNISNLIIIKLVRGYRK